MHDRVPSSFVVVACMAVRVVIDDVAKQKRESGEKREKAFVALCTSCYLFNG